MKAAILTREYPPEVYGGAGVHVEYLARDLARLEDVTVHCWGADRPDRDRGYWRDVGTLDSYYDAHMDLVSVHPVFNLYNRQWPILTSAPAYPPAKFVFEEEGRTGHALDSMVCSGVVISGGAVRRSVLSPSVHIHSYADIEGSILFPGVDVGRHAVVRNAIVDKDVVIAPGAEVGVDPEADRERFDVSPGGIVVIGKGRTVEA